MNELEQPSEARSRKCSRCGDAIRAGAHAGICPRCTLRSALEPDVEPESRPSFPMHFAGYDLLEKLGEGGMGIVYKARQVGGIERVVALKRIREGEIAGAAARRKFLDEAKKTAELEHPNIVRIYEVRDSDGEPYFTMALMSGGTLIQHAARFAEPKQAAILVAKIARAVHAGHEKHIIHRDLKPANILFDDHGEPHITDFGVAKRIDKDAGASTTMIGGTACYMAPEQATGHAKRDTVAADVWSLGVILYELVAGKRPFYGPTPLEVLRHVVEDQPEHLERMRQKVDRDFATICHTCLQKEPERRYISAQALAEDLERYVRGEAPLARRPGPLVRSARWCKRHPAATVLFGSAAITLISFSIWSAISAREQERARRQEVLAANGFAARAVAGTVLAQLREYADIVANEAQDPQLPDLLERRDDARLTERCEAFYARHSMENSAIDWWFFMSDDGFGRAHAPMPKFGKTYYQNFAFRDYYRGAAALPESMPRPVYVSRAIHSHADDRYRLVIAAPIRNSRNELKGILAAMITTGQHIGALELSDERRFAALAVRRDRDLATEPLPDEHILLVHNGVVRGEGIVIESDALRRLTARRDAAGIPPQDQLRFPPAGWIEVEDDYVDHLASPDGETSDDRWLAGIAPVGNTELAVIVQTRINDATALDIQPFRVLLAWSIGAAVLLLGAVVVVLRTLAKIHRPI